MQTFGHYFTNNLMFISFFFLCILSIISCLVLLLQLLEFDVLCHFWLLVKKVIERKCDVRAAQKEMREYGLESCFGSQRVIVVDAHQK